MKSYRSTTAGVIAILMAVLPAIQSMLDGAEVGSIDWQTTIVAIAAGIGLISARDNKVTSEKAGAK